MEHNEIYISKYSAWAPGMETRQEWEEWANGKREMICSSESPKLDFTDSMFRRRISQISKMTIQTVHDILPVQEKTKMIFISFRGEISRQFSVNKMEIEEGSILPAAFSLSVFNTPVALASMAFELKGGYTALYPADDSIAAGLYTAQAMLNTESQNEIIVVYADENIPEEYSGLVSKPLPPFAFGLLLSKEKSSETINYKIDNVKKINPKEFLKEIILQSVS